MRSLPAILSCLLLLASLPATAESSRGSELAAALGLFNPEAVARAIDHLDKVAAERLGGREALRRRLAGTDPLVLREALAKGDPEALAKAEALVGLKREVMLANPALDFEKILCIRRPAKGNLGLPQNWESNSSLNPFQWADELATLPIRTPGAPLMTLFKPEPGRMISDIDLDFSGQRMLFSMPGRNGRWQIHEMEADGRNLNELPLIPDGDIDNYDACYLPDGNIAFTSTAPLTGVPCVQGSSHVTNTYLFTRATGTVRRLTFDQEHNWCPTVLNNGQILYQRWEYSDLPHFAARMLFTMNPDGTNQRSYYGSNSYWPNAIFYARPIPGHPSQVVGIVGGHHGVPRMGELVIFDPAKGRFEADGVVQRLPGWGREVKPVIQDQLVDGSWPKFLHPFPLSATLFLVSAKPAPDSAWGLYLVDVYDNLLLLKEEPGMALFEPMPLKSRPAPPVIPPRVDLAQKTATVFLQDIYLGEGLKGVPRGTIRQLRLFTYQFAYHTVGGQVNRVGLTGPWDIKRVLGTVPVNPDGSACFRIPANTPVSIQPLDANGEAVTLMRSWMTAMPGEALSCIGCHESANSVPATVSPQASRQAAAEIVPWHGPVRGFGFRQEVQPALDRLCVGCHNGTRPELPDFRDRPEIPTACQNDAYRNGTKFSPAYLALRPYVRSATIEADLHLLLPGEFKANTSELVQRLRQGHHGVALDADFWDRILTWIDLGTPYHGSWASIVGAKHIEPFRARRLDLLKRYGGRDDDEETTAAIPAAQPAVLPPPEPVPVDPLARQPWGFGTDEASRRQQALGEVRQSLDLGNGIRLELVRIPAGEFILGSAGGAGNERPLARVRIDKPFWIGRCEVTNAQYACFDTAHDSRREPPDFLQFSERERGYPTNQPEQPACRLSWLEAQAFCQWLGTRTGHRVMLPTEAQWEWACRAGTDGPFFFGDGMAFGKYANLADRTFRKVDTWGWGLPSGAIPEWRLAAVGQDDGFRVSSPVGKFLPNAWGVHDMCGNVAEWTRSDYRPYPYADGRNGGDPAADKAVRGGSWYDRPGRATSSSRLGYPPWQKVFNIGFRIVVEE